MDKINRINKWKSQSDVNISDMKPMDDPNNPKPATTALTESMFFSVNKSGAKPFCTLCIVLNPIIPMNNEMLYIINDSIYFEVIYIPATPIPDIKHPILRKGFLLPYIWLLRHISDIFPTIGHISWDTPHEHRRIP